MSLEASIVGGVSNAKVEVDSTFKAIKVQQETDAFTNPLNVGCVRQFAENDNGYITGAPFLYSPEADADYRQRTGIDVLLDSHVFNYTTQHYRKHYMLATTLVPSWTLGAFNTNPTSLTTTGAGTILRTWSTFPILGTTTTAIDIEGSFTATPTANVIVEFGGALPAAAVTGAPIDGVFFRLTSAGMQGVITYNGTETASPVFPIVAGSGTPWAYTINKKYQFIVYLNQRNAQFWINDGTGAQLYATINTPSGNGQPCASASVPFFVRQYHSGAAGAALSFALACYSVRAGGPDFVNQFGVNGNCYEGNYAGLSGSTSTPSLMSGTVTTGTVVAPTAAVPTNTTAALGTGLGGLFYETITLASGTDGIVTSYQVPTLLTATAATYTPAKRLRINGVSITSFVQTVFVSVGHSARFYLAFGHTALSLQTTDAATAKAPTRVNLPFVQNWVTNAAAYTTPTQSVLDYKFTNPIYVNPGEYVQLVTSHLYGTVPTSGVAAHQVSFDYSWE